MMAQRKRLLIILREIATLGCLVVINAIWDEGYRGYAVALLGALVLPRLTSWIQGTDREQLKGFRDFIKGLSLGTRIQTFGVLVFLVSAPLNKPPQLMVVAGTIFVTLLVYTFYLKRWNRTQ